MNFPELKSIGDLSVSDFERFPVWVGVHTLDVGEPWYHLSDETTYRPWTGPFPAPAEMFVLVLAAFVFRDGSVYPGFVTAVRKDWDEWAPVRRMSDGTSIKLRGFRERQGGSELALLGLQQPCVFRGSGYRGFWGGRKGVSREPRDLFYEQMQKRPEEIFPIHFQFDEALAAGLSKGIVHGFYKLIRDAPPAVET